KAFEFLAQFTLSGMVLGVTFDDEATRQLEALRFTADDQYLYAGKGELWGAHNKLGAHPIHLAGRTVGTYFAVCAPNAREVSVMGDFNHWNPHAHRMQRCEHTGIWYIYIPDIKEGTLYKYSILGADGVRRQKADPYSFFNQFPTGDELFSNASISWDLSYEWQDAKWMGNRRETQAPDKPMAVYEVHLGSWRRGEYDRWLTYREHADQLVNYVAELGFTHVELLPVTEYAYDPSWGYQVSNYYAPSSRFGEPQDFMYLVDQLHKRGIGVIVDWVPAHFPKDSHGLERFDGTELYSHEDPLFGEHPDWGTLIPNYDRNEARNFFIGSALVFCERYHIDGIRVDAVASMLYLDYSRGEEEKRWIIEKRGTNINWSAVAFLRRFNEIVHERHPGVLTIAEESTNWAGVSRPSFLDGLGFDIKWSMGWMHDMLKKYMALDPIHRSYEQGKLTFYLLYAFHENFMLPLSHDEVVHGKGSLKHQMPGEGDEWQQFANLRLLLCNMLTFPGKKLLFMGGEFGEFKEWDHSGSLDWWLLNKVNTAAEGEEENWVWQYPLHGGLWQMVRDIVMLYRREPSLHERDFEHTGFEWIDCEDAGNSVISYIRKGRDPDNVLAVASNYTPVVRHDYRIGVPFPGTWHEVFNSDAEDYGGSGVGNFGAVEAEAIPFHGHPYSVSLTLPPLATIILKGKNMQISIKKPADGGSQASCFVGFGWLMDGLLIISLAVGVLSVFRGLDRLVKRKHK
ncbi:1,4-alpha-glucan branching protein GlgB, partial [Candidatus Omnitrophota bacterium]